MKRRQKLPQAIDDLIDAIMRNLPADLAIDKRSALDYVLHGPVDDLAPIVEQAIRIASGAEMPPIGMTGFSVSKHPGVLLESYRTDRQSTFTAIDRWHGPILRIRVIAGDDAMNVSAERFACPLRSRRAAWRWREIQRKYMAGLDQGFRDLGLT